MRKRLLKPPQRDGEILIIPSYSEILSWLKPEVSFGVCHQPYFFNPGISLKFFFLESLPIKKREILFLDSDRIRLEVKIPTPDGGWKLIKLLERDEILYEYPMPEPEMILSFLDRIEDELRDLKKRAPSAYICFSEFKRIFLTKLNRKFLKQALAETFMEYAKINLPYRFLSELLGEEFRELFLEIYQRADEFREIFNQALADYRREYRFRYKNFPYPKLREEELPFWLIKGNRRLRCFRKDLNLDNLSEDKIFPRASTLTIFLRLYKFGVFVHGVGGGNYEWIQDRIIERFFKLKPPPYIILTATFLIPGSSQRDFPYFLYPPEELRRCLEKIKSFLP